MSIYQKRKLLENRRSKPVFKRLGDIDLTDVEQYLPQSQSWSIKDTLALRDQNNIKYELEKLKHYNHSMIQTATDTTMAINYNNVSPEYAGLVDMFEQKLGKVFRMRWAMLQQSEDLDWHIDPPNGDRFICLYAGTHTVHVRTDNGIVSQPMLPGELWYLNSNWYHSVENTGGTDRYAILGCFNLDT